MPFYALRIFSMLLHKIKINKCIGEGGGIGVIGEGEWVKKGTVGLWLYRRSGGD